MNQQQHDLLKKFLTNIEFTSDTNWHDVYSHWVNTDGAQGYSLTEYLHNYLEYKFKKVFSEEDFLTYFKFDEIYEQMYFSVISIAHKKPFSLVLPRNIKRINSNAFSNFDFLTGITIPESVLFVGRSPFWLCRNLKQVTFLPSSHVIALNSNAFSSCDQLTSVVLPDSLLTLGETCFYDCSVLSSIMLPKPLREIGDSAFQKCVSLRTINIPKAVNHIGYNAFDGCTKLKTISYEGTKKEWDDFKTQIMGGIWLKHPYKIVCTDGEILHETGY